MSEAVSSSCVPLMNFGCGVVAGIMASLATQPADVVKTSIQISQSHCSMMKVVRHIYTVSLAGFWTCVQEPGRNVCSHTVSSLPPSFFPNSPLLSSPHSPPPPLLPPSQEQGMGGFFRGAVPRCLRRTLMAAMAWTVYEQLMAQMGLKS